ncbi:MAG: hypothetical protein LBF32_02200 [Streptococcaceae bacterium]|jgi:hypothetical protein|nr:hypothetical protein [Streptococcaceae bacterium]
MTKQIMDIDTLYEYIANTFGTTKVLVQKNNCVLTIEPISSAKNDLETISVDKTKAGTLTHDDFTELKIFTQGFKFNRDEANVRR